MDHKSQHHDDDDEDDACGGGIVVGMVMTNKICRCSW